MKKHLHPKQTPQTQQPKPPLRLPLPLFVKQKPPLKLTYRIPLRLLHLPI
jgi:hypothetical protein